MTGVGVKMSLKMPKILFNLNKFVLFGMKDGAENVAKAMQDDARKFLEKGISSDGGKSSGKLSKAILVKDATPGIGNLVRYDLIVDTSRAPYALWIELGRNAGLGLPYSKKGGRDYSKSQYAGTGGGMGYLRPTVEKYSQNSITLPIIAVAIQKQLVLLKSTI